MVNYDAVQLTDLVPLPCPCGTTRRAFTDRDIHVASVHLVNITGDARAHHHQRMTEIYVILEGTGHVEVDGHQVPVQPMTAIYLRPGSRHRASGNLRLLNIAVPAFDPEDEHLD